MPKFAPRVDDPVCRVEWRDASTLHGNAYNPNVVFDAELRLLERSILRTGWVQPILIAEDGTIIDGFHRWRVARDSAELRKRYGGAVPCAVLTPDPAHARILTIRMNRAKGTHVAVRMSAIVHELIDQFHMDPQEIAAEIGAGRDEVDLLYQDGVFAQKNIKDYRYGKAWVPIDKVNHAVR